MTKFNKFIVRLTTVIEGVAMFLFTGGGLVGLTYHIFNNAPDKMSAMGISLGFLFLSIPIIAFIRFMLNSLCNYLFDLKGETK